jgi:sugar O-acyltransferase (sialic acid O-acetyltransferase NeuD family)
MIPITVPVSEVNAEAFTITEWLFLEGASVRAGQTIGYVETAKAIYEVIAPCDGILGIVVPAGDTGMFQRPVGYVFVSREALDAWRRGLERPAADPQPHAAAVTATAKALELARKHAIDLVSLGPPGRLVTEKMVEAVLERRRRVVRSPVRVAPRAAPPGVRRLALIGAGYGASQVLDILSSDRTQQAVALFDDNAELWGTEAYGLPVIAGSDALDEVFRGGGFDAAIVTISTSVPVRTKFRALSTKLGIPLANAIDPSCRLARDVSLGTGNVLNAFCFIGAGTVIGDNNFFSAYNSIDHHCDVGSDLSTGPGCMVSGLVRIGDGVRMGTGVFVQPYLSIGAGVQIASGAVIVNDVPAGHAVKTKVITTRVTPIGKT